MARHTRRRPLTREDLLHRYANTVGITFGEAHDRATEFGNDELRDLVERIESDPSLKVEGRRKSFAQSQPTTTARGQTR